MVIELGTFKVECAPESPAGLAKAKDSGAQTTYYITQSKNVRPLVENLSHVQGPSQCASGDHTGHTLTKPALDGPFPRVPDSVGLRWG